MTDGASAAAAGLGGALWALSRLSEAGLALVGGYVVLAVLPNCLLGTGLDACSLLTLAGPGHLLPVLVGGSVLGRAGCRVVSHEPPQE